MDIPTWRACTKGEQHRRVSKFMHMDPGQLTTLGVPELALLFQWMFELKDMETVKAMVQEQHFDLELVNHGENDRPEFARVHLSRPISAVYHLTTELQGRDIKRIFIFTLETFPVADDIAERNSPLFLRLFDRAATIRKLQETRTKYREMLGRKRDYYAAPKIFTRKSGIQRLWGKFRDFLSKNP